MLEKEYRNITDLFLDVASEDIGNKQFKEAANLIVMTITEFDEHTDIIKFLAYLFKTMPRQDIESLITELSQEMMWLCPKSYITKNQRYKMLSFRKQASALFLAHGFHLGTEKDCLEMAGDKTLPLPVYMFAWKKKNSSSHPY